MYRLTINHYKRKEIGKAEKTSQQKTYNFKFLYSHPTRCVEKLSYIATTIACTNTLATHTQRVCYSSGISNNNNNNIKKHSILQKCTKIIQ